MQEMRELPCLLIQFRETAREEGLDCDLGMEMSSRVRLPILRQAIDDLASEKYGKKLNAIVVRTIKSMKGMYAEAMEDAKAVELDRFHDAYKFRSHEVFASARYRAVAQSMNKARRPGSLPEEVELRTLKIFVTNEIKCLPAKGKWRIMSSFAPWLRAVDIVQWKER